MCKFDVSFTFSKRFLGKMGREKRYTFFQFESFKTRVIERERERECEKMGKGKKIRQTQSQSKGKRSERKKISN